MLFQLPPNLKSDAARLRDFVSLFPKGLRAVFEFRNDSWFDEYMFEIATHKKYVPKELVEAWQQEPIHLPPWDPMGALAR